MNITYNLTRILKSELLVQSLISVFIRIVGAISAFALSMYLGRVLGAEESGYYFLCFTIVTFVSAVSRFGLDNTVLRFVASLYKERDVKGTFDVLIKSLLITFAFSSILSFFMFCYSDAISEFFNKPKLASVLKNMSFGTMFLSLFTILSMYLQGIRKTVSAVFILNISTNLLLILLLMYFYTNKSSDVAYLYTASSFATVFLGLALIFTIKKKNEELGELKGQERKISTITWNEVFSSCVPLWVVVIMSVMTQWSGHFISGIWVESTKLAQLAVAQRTAMLVSFVLVAVNMVVAPKFSSYHKSGREEEIKRTAYSSIRLVLVIALPIVGLMLVFPSQIMILFGSDFSGGALTLQLLVLGQLINVVSGSVGILLSMTGHEKDLRNITIVSGMTSIILNLILVPLFGVNGSAIATSLAMMMQNLLSVYYVRIRLGFNTLLFWVR